MALLAVVTLLAAAVTSARANESDQYTGAVVLTSAVVGGRANLPCSLTSEKPGDRPDLVLWYRDNAGAPIHSFDARQGSLSDGVQWKDNFILANRNAEFLVNTSPPVLAIDDVREADAGEYRCRVDFKLTPTKYHRVNLTVIVPPTRPVIRLPTGDRVGDILGPLTEGDKVQLSCETRGGRPAPSLSWWRGPTLLSNAHVVTSSGVLRSVLHLPAISRSDVDQTLTCHATNNNISKPLSSSVLLKTYFPPLYVRLVGRNRAFSLGRVHHVTCKTAGSRPQPQITWWIHDVQLQDYTIQTSLDGNETTSVLSLNASREHNGKHLTCRVTNPEMDSTVMEDAWRITVKYPPEVSLTVGKPINPADLREGDDVYMECRVRANPTIFQIEWLHDGHVLQPNQREGIVMSNMSLVLQRLTRHRSGHYVCRVANSEGENVSNPVQLSIQHAPACLTNQRRQYHVAKYEQVTVPCQVDANPASVKFQWKLNNSAEFVQIASDRIHTSGTVSELTMTPSGDEDFGTLICTSYNDIGQQLEPCLFDIIPIEDESSGLQFTPLVGILLGAIIALLLIAVAVVLTLRRVRARELRAARRDTEESREKMLSMHTLDSDRVGDKSPDVVPCTSTLLDKRKGGGSHYESRRSKPPGYAGMPSISETISIAPNSSLPRRMTPLEYLDPRLCHTDLHTFPKPPSPDPYTNHRLVSEIPGFPKAPTLSPDFYDSMEASESDTKELDTSWQESVV
ncbi:hemicentin-2-like isoform X2 [Amphibalanus amphitrite]|uniref:hemicentin-2-like isoform X2 n=1 Tax=Amphibalanus amphitrite TaxID=1232801 RepID=UPI001C8FEFC1|nr:hemicentin-2-like isoform X2 [Amphibalanus amphitrite]XP_043227549.1 hemicentin-2-like isoform X2 [Amphibalanus amphitrite]